MSYYYATCIERANRAAMYGAPKAWDRGQRRAPCGGPRFRGMALDLGLMVQRLKGEDFERRAVRMRPGRERRFLEDEPIVSELTVAIKADSDARQKIESFLDELFESFTVGERFRHTDAVICLLMAIFQADPALLNDIASVFAETSVAEVGQLRRFAEEMWMISEEA